MAYVDLVFSLSLGSLGPFLPCPPPLPRGLLWCCFVVQRDLPADSPDIESDGSSAADLTVKSGATTTRGVSGTAEMVGKWAQKEADTRGQRWSRRQVGNHDEWFSTAGEYFLPQTT